MSPRFAWPTYKDQWDCRVDQLLLDGQDAPDAISSDYLRIEGQDREWEDAEITLHASTTEVRPEGLTDLAAYVLIACTATQLRLSYPMTYSTIGDEFEVTFTIPRSAVAGKATIAVELVSNRGGRQRIVGSSVNWTLAIDKGEAPLRAGAAPLHTTWVDFAGLEAPLEARRNPLAYCYIDINKSPPVLYLNGGIDGLQSLILADNAKLERRRHRDLLGAMIARQVANSLIRAAVEDIAPGEFGAPAIGPTSRVLQEMCEALSSELPETETAQDFYELVASLLGDATGVARFWADVDLALDRMTSLSDTVARVCSEVKHV